jgi:NAD(P)-dependent dehydrogenase (short-subunit alcohol dehydrogenase family)
MPAASKALALEYAPNNGRFNTVSPGVVNTPMHAKGNHAELAKFHPLGRIGECLPGLRKTCPPDGASLSPPFICITIDPSRT